MEERPARNRASKSVLDQELTCIIQLWRAQRRKLNRSLEENLLSDLDPTSSISSEKKLESLCEGLMDYLSVGHFKVYEKLLRSYKLSNPDRIRMISSIYRNIENSTDHALSFNERYEEPDYPDYEHPMPGLPNDLKKLSRSMAIRFVLEEQLVEIMRSPTE